MSDPFHLHLEACRQCAEHPFELCPVGAKLIEQVALGLSPTGRVKDEPRLQDFPVRTELGDQLRKAFNPEPGTVFIAMDYAPLEMRMYAEFGGEHDRHEARVNDCPMCAAGIPKRKATDP